MIQINENIKEISRLESNIQKIESNLINPNFIQKAPQKVVELEKKKLLDFKNLLIIEKEKYNLNLSMIIQRLENLLPLEWHIEYLREREGDNSKNPNSDEDIIKCYNFIYY